VTLKPISLKTAKEFVKAHHRHNSPPQGHKFSVGLEQDERLIGVVIVGRPIARHNDDGYTAEVTRCCVLPGHHGANSKLYAAAWRAVKGMGYTRLISYTLPSESGASLRAAGFSAVRITKPSPKGWNVPSRPRKKSGKYPDGEKILWEIKLKTP
jgi:hypothetical protein